MDESTPTETVVDGTTDVRLGDRVVYTDSKGFEKFAFVTGTQATVKVVDVVGEDDEDDYHRGSSLPAVGAGQAHLLVFSPTGNVYTRHNIPQGAGPNTFAPIV